MAEAASQLDLQVLSDLPDDQILVPSSKKASILNRPIQRFVVLILLLSSVGVLIRWIINSLDPWYYPVFVVVTIGMYFRRDRVKGIYKIMDDGLEIPYSWFYKRSIPLENIIRVVDDVIEDETDGREYSAIRIILDTELIKFNITGLQSPSILLSTREYDSHDLNRFADKLTKMVREDPSTPNTLAKRLTDQVNRAWENQWKLIFFNTFDSASEFLIYLFIIDLFFLAVLEFTIWPILGIIVLGSYTIIVFLIQVLEYKPQAIVGIRPHELGPLIYDEEEIISSVRFIIMCRPYTVHLRHCEVIYDEGATKQVGKMKQIHPEYVEPGELTYGVAQILGNHTKAKGAKIQFSYKEKEDDEDLVYEIQIEWS